MSEITSISNTIIVPDNNKDKKLFNKKGFTNSSIKRIHNLNYFLIPDKYYCSYSIIVNKEGGVMGVCDSSLETWTVYNKKTKKPLVTIKKFSDGDYPSSDIITWH